MANSKKYALHADQIKSIAVGYGGCVASDMITVEGKRVGLMYRDAPQDEQDSGWCFTAGLESQAYMDDLNNHGVYDINVIANFDPDITEFLESPVGSSFVRDVDGKLLSTTDDTE